MTAGPLSASQRLMLRCSAGGAVQGEGGPVRLMGGGNWQTARSLEARGLGWIEGGRPAGSALAGVFYANSDGLAVMTRALKEPNDV